MVEAVGELNSHNILKVPIARVGSWKHDTYGTVAFTAQDFSDAITNFNEGALGFEPHLTFGHLDEEPNSTDSARKRGDLKYLMVDGDNLDGYFNVPPGTADIVAGGGYEYSSGEFIRNLLDKGNGERRGMAISRVALTNTPYLPWGVDGKIQLLSHGRAGSPDGGDTPVEVITSVIRLSTNIQGEVNMTGQSIPEQASPTTGAATSIPEAIPQVAVPVELAPVINAITPSTNIPQAVASAASTLHPGVDVEAITAAVMAKVKADQERVKEEEARAKAVVDAETERVSALAKAELVELRERLAKAETNASMYSNHASRAAQEAEVNQLMSMGASAVIVNRYAAIRQALESKGEVVKLSQGGVEVETSLMDSIRDLLVGALQQTPVVTHQIGLAGMPTEQEGGVEGYLKKVAAENRQKATRTSI
jgi:hypothetical protein